MSSAPVSCTNCHEVSSSDGKISWVCDNCLAINPSLSAPKPPPDAKTAQAEINAAAAEALKIFVVK